MKSVLDGRRVGGIRYVIAEMGRENTPIDESAITYKYPTRLKGEQAEIVNPVPGAWVRGALFEWVCRGP